MAVYRHKSDVLPIATGGWKGLFFCCYGKNTSSDDTSKDQVVKHVDYGSTGRKKNGKKGNAYAYEDRETSSDSDDEDLKNFKQAQKQRGSVRSIDVEKAVAAEETQQHYDNQAYELETSTPTGPDAPLQVVSTEVTVQFDVPDGPEQVVVMEEVVATEESPTEVLSVPPSGYASYAGTPRGSLTPSIPSMDLKRFRSEGVSVAGTDSIYTETEDSLQWSESQPRSQDSIKSHEHLFDVSDLHADTGAGLISKCGQLEVVFNYEPAQCKMNITVHNAKDIPTKDRGGANSTQVRMLLLPTKKQRHKTKIRTGENPAYDESFSFKVPPDSAREMGVRFRLYGCERMRRERMIGESMIGFASLSLDAPQTHILTLEPRVNISPRKPKSQHGDSRLDVSSLSRSDSASSTQSMQHGGMPELLMGLSYNGTTGRMSVEVIKGSNFRNMAMQRAPACLSPRPQPQRVHCRNCRDTYVKLTLMSANGQEIARSKTSIRRGQPNPLYKETFMFQVALFQLPDVTLMVSVYNKRSMKRKDMIGWFSTGLNSSGEEELSHWKDMVDSKGEQVCRWHVLLEA